MLSSRNSKIQVILDQENDPDLDDEWLTADERLTHFIKDRERIVERTKVAESPYVQGPQYFEEELIICERYPISTKSKSVSETITNMNH